MPAISKLRSRPGKCKTGATVWPAQDAFEQKNGEALGYVRRKESGVQNREVHAVADNAKIAKGRAAPGEMLDKLEEEAAEAWWGSLSAEQREVFCELQDAHHGLYVLEQKIQKARAEARKRREKNE
jgi:hypothetical protein